MKNLIQRLETYNAWRRGNEDIPQPDPKEVGEMIDDAINQLSAPAKIHVCTCKQCRHVKGKRKNRNRKSAIKRLMNKRRRKDVNKVINFYWA